MSGSAQPDLPLGPSTPSARDITVRRVALATAVLPLTAVLLSACGSGSSATSSTAATPAVTASAITTSSTATTSDPAQPAVIHISSFKFKTPASVSPGSSVSVMNMDGEAHTVTADSGGAFDVKALPGKTVSFTAPTKPGSYPFHCSYHSEMHGVLVVK